MQHQISDLFYVNPYTDELVRVRRSPFPEVEDRTREALRGQGVTQMGTWMKADFMNWGISAMAKWKYSRVSTSVGRYIENAIDIRRRKINERKSRMLPAV